MAFRSHQVALNRFLQLERRYQRDPDKCIRYKEGIEEYFELGQITPAVSSERSTVSTCTKPVGLNPAFFLITLSIKKTVSPPNSALYSTHRQTPQTVDL